MRILYIDHFDPKNSNLIWLSAFSRRGEVKTYDVYSNKLNNLIAILNSFRPHHIHLGGSVKKYMIPLEMLDAMRKKATISVFYGDAAYSKYHYDLAKHVDMIYISNKTHIEKNKSAGSNYVYMPCPTDTNIFYNEKLETIYDLSFIGNNNQPNRYKLVKHLHDKYNMHVFGSGWDLKLSNPGVYNDEFRRVCCRSKICISILDDKHTGLDSYFSNRLINIMATGGCCITSYSTNLESVFDRGYHVEWFKSIDELDAVVENCLSNSNHMNNMGNNALNIVRSKYTYDKSVDLILSEWGK